MPSLQTSPPMMIYASSAPDSAHSAQSTPVAYPTSPYVLPHPTHPPHPTIHPCSSRRRHLGHHCLLLRRSHPLSHQRRKQRCDRNSVATLHESAASVSSPTRAIP